MSTGAGAEAGSNDTVVNMASDEEEDAIEAEVEDEYDDMISPTTTTDDGLASPTFESHHQHHQHGCPVDQHHQHGCPVDQQRTKPDPAMQTIQDAKFIAQHVKNQDKFDEVGVKTWTILVPVAFIIIFFFYFRHSKIFSFFSEFYTRFQTKFKMM